MSIPKVLLKDGCNMPVLGLGTWLASGQPTSWALEIGYRLIDTASLYNNEEEVGKAIRESSIPRKDSFVVTKLWNSDHGRESTIAAFNQSLSRLGMDYVDLYLMHSAMGGKTLETWDAMVELKKKGLIRSLGVSNFNKHHLMELQKARPGEMPVVNQIEIHPFLAWDDCVSFCRSEGILVMAYSPLAKAEKLSNEVLCSIAKKYGKSAAQVMIKWSLQQGFVCIPKTSKKERIKENMAVFDFEMDSGDMQTLTGLSEGYISEWPEAMDSVWTP